MMDKDGIWEISPREIARLSNEMSRRTALRGGAAVLGSLLVGGGLLGCGSDDGSSTSESAAGGGKPGDGKTIALSLNGFNTYCQNLAEGVLKALDGTGYALIGSQAAFDATKEVSNIKQLVGRQPDALLVQPASADGAARASLSAQRADIPVFITSFESVNKQTDAVYYAGTKLESDPGARMVVDFIVDQGVTSGKILEIIGLDAEPFSAGFKKGLRAALAAQPGLTIAASQQGLYTADGALKVLKPMLSAHPDTKVIIDYAAEMGIAIAGELERRGRKDIVHITGDGNDRLGEWLKKDDGAYVKATRWYSAGQEGVVMANMARVKLERDAAPVDSSIRVPGYKVIPGSSAPVLMSTHQAIATAENIDTLPPFGYPEYTDQITFGG